MAPPPSGVALGLGALGLLVVQEIRHWWQAATEPSGTSSPLPAEAVAHSAQAAVASPVSGIFEQVRSTLLCVALGVALGVGFACHLWLGYGSRAQGTDVHLAVDTSVVVGHQHERRQGVAENHRRRHGRGVLEGGATRRSIAGLVQ